MGGALTGPSKIYPASILALLDDGTTIWDHEVGIRVVSTSCYVIVRFIT